MLRELHTPLLPEAHVPVGYCWQNSRCRRSFLRSRHNYLGDFVSHSHPLSPNGRRNLLRSQKAFDEWSGGTTRLDAVSDKANLEKGKSILRQLHQMRWTEAGVSGVFRSPLYLRFHDAIMRDLLEQGALELLWLSARGEPVAALYGMTWGEKVSAYQTGRRTDLPGHLRPGAVLLALAIRRAIERGRREFDLLADDAPYKRQFASQARPLVQVRAVHPSLLEQMRRVTCTCWGGLRAIRQRLKWGSTHE